MILLFRSNFFCSWQQGQRRRHGAPKIQWMRRDLHWAEKEKRKIINIFFLLEPLWIKIFKIGHQRKLWTHLEINGMWFWLKWTCDKKKMQRFFWKIATNIIQQIFFKMTDNVDNPSDLKVVKNREGEDTKKCYIYRFDHL